MVHGIKRGDINEKRIIVLLFGVLLLTGCTADYNLEIDNNLLKEEITGMVSKNELNENNSEAPNTVSSLINEEQYPLLIVLKYMIKN